ncbi:MAG: hypothetical protein JXB30_01195 [Anaerolineae bacterium]|nr:hypothetical protein [Anaerolineae bacterium]
MIITQRNSVGWVAARASRFLDYSPPAPPADCYPTCSPIPLFVAEPGNEADLLVFGLDSDGCSPNTALDESSAGSEMVILENQSWGDPGHRLSLMIAEGKHWPGIQRTSILPKHFSKCDIFGILKITGEGQSLMSVESNNSISPCLFN